MTSVLSPQPLSLTPQDKALGRELILEELFDLTLYRHLRRRAAPDIQRIVDELIPIEEQHVMFWEHFFGWKAKGLGVGRWFRLWLLRGLCILGGSRAILMVLEAIEVNGIRKYLRVWERYRSTPLGEAVRSILEDEFEHEDAIVLQQGVRRISPDQVRSAFLGVNDGLVEILGAVSGFFAAFGASPQVLMASFSVAVAGAFSMAAGSYVAVSAEKEVADIQRKKNIFLDREIPDEPRQSPLASALTVGTAYFFGALVPVLPVAWGARQVYFSFLAAGVFLLGVSAVLSFLSGMHMRRRIAINLLILAAAVGLSYGIGMVARSFWGITV